MCVHKKGCIPPPTAITNDPWIKEMVNDPGRTLVRVERHARGISAVSGFRDSYLDRLNIARVCAQYEVWDYARALIARSIAECASQTELQVYADVRLEEGRVAEAREALQIAEKVSHSYLNLIALARCSYDVGNYRECASLTHEAARLVPERMPIQVEDAGRQWELHNFREAAESAEDQETIAIAVGSYIEIGDDRAAVRAMRRQLRRRVRAFWAKIRERAFASRA